MPWVLLRHSPKLNIVPPPRLHRHRLPVHAHLALRDPDSQQDEVPHDEEYHQRCDENNDAVHGDPPAPTGPVWPRVQEAVGVEAFGRVRYVREGEVQRQDDDEPKGVDPGERLGARDDELEEGEEGVDSVLRDFLPGVEGLGVPGVLVEDGPVDDGDEEGVRHDGGIEERVESLEGPREAVDERLALNSIGEGVERREEEVEEEAPVREDGEVGELVANTRAAFRGAAGVIHDYAARDEDVEALQAVSVGTSPRAICLPACRCRVLGARRTHKDEAQDAKRGSRKNPRRHEAIGGIPKVRAKGEGPEHGAHLAVQPR